MPKKSVEARLQSLQDKRDAVAAEIKKIQSEKARELRKRQQLREALVGRVIYQLVADGATIIVDTWTEDSLIQLMDAHLVRQRDRQLFGLGPLGSLNKSVKKEAAAKGISAQLVNGKTVPHSTEEQQAVASTNALTNGVRSGVSGREKSPAGLPATKIAVVPKRQLAESSSQDDLMGEFNL